MRPFHVVGEFAFVIGIALAFAVGFFADSLNAVAMSITFIIIGLVIGLLSVTDKDTNKFLIAAIALLVAGGAGLQAFPLVSEFASSIFTNIITLVAPAAIVVAIRSIYSTASGGEGFIYQVIKRNGTLQIFMKDKIVRSCMKAGAKRPVAERVADEVAARVSSGTSTRKIAAMVIASLRKHDRKSAASYQRAEARKK